MRTLLNATLVLCLGCGLAFAQAPSPSRVPLREGLVITTAIHEPGHGDFESIKQFDAVTRGPRALHLHAEQARRPSPCSRRAACVART